jgi:hypothetical protein
MLGDGVMKRARSAALRGWTGGCSEFGLGWRGILFGLAYVSLVAWDGVVFFPAFSYCATVCASAISFSSSVFFFFCFLAAGRDGV